MKNRLSKKYRRILLFVFFIFLAFFITNAITIYNYSFEYSEEKSDVAIVLGAGTDKGVVSPIFKERLNHSVYLFNENRVDMILLTGGYGDKQNQSDSYLAKHYLLSQGIPNEVILIEEKSRYTIENLSESIKIMDSLGLKSALIVTDPLHMKRSIELAKKIKIDCEPSPTKTTMYRSFFPKTKSLLYEAFYYSLGQITGKN